jgi:hypothetical protein
MKKTNLLINIGFITSLSSALPSKDEDTAVNYTDERAKHYASWYRTEARVNINLRGTTKEKEKLWQELRSEYEQAYKNNMDQLDKDQALVLTWQAEADARNKLKQDGGSKTAQYSSHDPDYQKLLDGITKERNRQIGVKREIESADPHRWLDMVLDEGQRSINTSFWSYGNLLACAKKTEQSNKIHRESLENSERQRKESDARFVAFTERMNRELGIKKDAEEQDGMKETALTCALEEQNAMNITEDISTIATQPTKDETEKAIEKTGGSSIARSSRQTEMETTQADLDKTLTFTVQRPIDEDIRATQTTDEKRETESKENSSNSGETRPHSPGTNRNSSSGNNSGDEPREITENPQTEEKFQIDETKPASSQVQNHTTTVETTGPESNIETTKPSSTNPSKIIIPPQTNYRAIQRSHPSFAKKVPTRRVMSALRKKSGTMKTRTTRQLGRPMTSRPYRTPKRQPNLYMRTLSRIRARLKIQHINRRKPKSKIYGQQRRFPAKYLKYA